MQDYYLRGTSPLSGMVTSSPCTELSAYARYADARTSKQNSKSHTYADRDADSGGQDGGPPQPPLAKTIEWG
ncbi:hypothetical protein CHU98_g5442 [Xylaria longipes]|nr:hypothetical protein CHU98_g5442 [Xylaria longipes]